MSQNFGNAIASRFLDTVSFDFWRNGENRFPARADVYNQLIEHVISSDIVPNTKPRKRVCNYAFLAGGFFTRYIQTYTTEEEYQALVERENVDVFVELPKGKTTFRPTLPELRSVLADRYRTDNSVGVENLFMKGVFCTFIIPNTVQIATDTFKNVRVHVCSENCANMLRKFTFEPCKIAYQYKTNTLRVCSWFQNGGNVIDNMALSQNSRELQNRYIHKNITNVPYDANPHTIVPFIFVQENLEQLEEESND